MDDLLPSSPNCSNTHVVGTLIKPHDRFKNAALFLCGYLSYQEEKVDELPVKARKPARKKRYFQYLVFEYNGLVYVKKREGKDIWKDLFEFYLFETHHLMHPDELVKQHFFRKIAGKDFELAGISPVQKQQLTHQELEGVFIHVKLKAPPVGLDSHIAVSVKSLSKLAFPKFILSYLREKNVN